MKLKLVCIVLLLGIAPAFAQKEGKFFSVGLRAGVNLSQFRGNDLSLGSSTKPWQLSDNSNRVYGATGGIFMRIGRTFYVQPEIMFSQKGGEFSLIDDKAQTSKSFKLTNIDFPVLLGVKIANVLRINAGPVASFNVSNSGSLRQAVDSYTGEATFNDAFKRSALGYQAGIGIDLGKLNIDLRYEGNLTEVVNLKITNPQTQAQFSRKLNLLQATVGVVF